MEFAKIGTASFLALGIGALLSFVLPAGLALLWIWKKKEPVTTVLIGAATFLVFALILEKPLLALVITGGHPVSRFLNATPVCWALVAGLFPGVFEETGRLVAFKTVLKKRKNRETSISHGIGHGGAEVIILLGLTYVTYIFYAVMINTGTFQTVIDQAAAQAPDQVDALKSLAGQLATLTAAGIGAAFVERAFAVLFHIGASILVFYACRDKGRFWLYPLAVLLHTAMDFVVALAQAGAVQLSTLALEAFIGVFGVLTFCGAFFLLYRRDRNDPSGSAGPAPGSDVQDAAV